MLLLLCVGVLLLMAAVTNGAGFSLDGIKGRTVGDGQHGTARFAGKGEIRRTFHRVRFRPRAWRRGKHLPKVQGLVVGCEMRGKRVTALVDGDDIHAMMVAGSGAGGEVCEDHCENGRHIQQRDRAWTELLFL